MGVMGAFPIWAFFTGAFLFAMWANLTVMAIEAVVTVVFYILTRRARAAFLSEHPLTNE